MVRLPKNGRCSPRTGYFVKRALKPVLNELDSRGGAHAFRHANATLLDSLSASMAVRQERLGHVDARHTHLVTADDCV